MTRRPPPADPDILSGTPAEPADAGFSLPELLVAMALTAVLLVALSGVFFSDLRTTSRINAKVTATADARLAVDTMSRRLRVAVAPDATRPAFEVTAPRAVTFYASLAGAAAGGVTTRATDPKPTKVDYSVVPVTYSGRSTSCLRETLTPAAGTSSPYTYPASGATSSCLAYGTLNADGSSLLTYFQSGSGSATPVTLDDVRSVGVSLTVTAASGSASATTSASTRVTCPNIRARGTT